jgi:hypothetical protein
MGYFLVMIAGIFAMYFWALWLRRRRDYRRRLQSLDNAPLGGGAMDAPPAVFAREKEENLFSGGGDSGGDGGGD